MRLKWNYRTVIGCIMMIALIAAGCSSDDGNKSTNVPTMTPEEQAALLAGFGMDMPTLAASMVPLAMLSVGGSFFDGITEEDFSDLDIFGPTGKRLRWLEDVVSNQARRNAASVSGNAAFGQLIGSLMRQASVSAETVTVIYDDAKGWWFVDAVIDLDEVAEGVALDMTLTLQDSIRFENVAGQAMRDPTELTSRFLHGYDFDLALDVRALDQGIDIDVKLDFDIAGYADVAGLNSLILLMTGGVALSADIDGEILIDDPNIEPVDMRFDGGFDMNADLMNVQLPGISDLNTDPCPMGGSMSADMAIDIDVTVNSERQRAKGDWGMSIVITEPGYANIDVYSGDYSVDADNVDICDGGF